MRSRRDAMHLFRLRGALDPTIKRPSFAITVGSTTNHRSLSPHHLRAMDVSSPRVKRRAETTRVRAKYKPHDGDACAPRLFRRRLPSSEEFISHRARRLSTSPIERLDHRDRTHITNSLAHRPFHRPFRRSFSFNLIGFCCIIIQIRRISSFSEI